MKIPIDRGRPSERRMLSGRRRIRNTKLSLMDIIRLARLKNKPEEEER